MSRPVLGIVLLVCLGAGLYWPSCHGPFVLDDYHSILTNRAVHSLNIASIWNFTRTRFLTYLTFAANWHFFRENTFSYHLVNAGLHIATTVLVWIFVSLLLKFFGCGTSNRLDPVILCFMSSLIFLVHPVQTQAVSYIVQRATCLATFFYLLGIILFLKFRLAEKLSAGKKWGWYLVAWVVTVMAMFTKEICFTLPIMLLLTDILIFAGRNVKERFQVHFPFLLTLTIIPSLFLFPRKTFNLGELGRVAEPAGVIAPHHYLFTQLRVLVTYVRLLLLPVNQNLDYQYFLFRSFFHLPVLLSFIFLVLLTAGAFALWRRGYRLAAYGIFWFFLTLSVESSFLPISDLIFEHRLYLPMAGYALLVTSGYCWSRQHGLKKLAGTAFVLMVFLYGTLTVKRNLLWADDLRLWLDTAEKSPNKPRVLNNLGAVYNNRRQYNRALPFLNRGLSLAPNFYPLYLNRGRSLMELGATQAALSDFLTALKLRPDEGDVHLNVAALYAQLGDYEKALFHHQRSIELLPDSAAAYNNRASTYTRMGRYDLAIADCQKALSLNPGLAEAYFNLASAWEEKGDKQKAIAYYTKAIELKPDYFDAYTNRGTTYRHLGQIDRAIADYTQAINLQPDNANAYNNRGNIFLEKREFEKALSDYNQALKIQPNHAVAYFNRAVAHFNLRNYQQAREDVKKAQQLGLRVPSDFLSLVEARPQR